MSRKLEKAEKLLKSTQSVLIVFREVCKSYTEIGLSMCNELSEKIEEYFREDKKESKWKQIELFKENH